MDGILTDDKEKNFNRVEIGVLLIVVKEKP
jgi:hypothetical protein